MKKILYSAIIFCCVLAMPVVAAMKSNSTNNDANQNNKSDLNRPIHATNIKIAKKIPASLAVKEAKGRPDTPPGQNKDDDDFSERAATGDLGTEAGGNKYAVVIGICDYPDGEKNYDICLSDGDSYHMYNALTGLYGYDPANIYWYRDMGDNSNGYGVDGAPTRENILNAVADIKSKTNVGEVVFFFSGHGTSGIANDGINGDDDGEYIDEGIVVHDGDGGIIDGNSQLDFIWDGELRNWFNGFSTTRIIFVFDTCLAGGMNDVVNDENNDVYDNRVVVMSSKETQSSYVYSTGELGEGMFSRYFVNEGMLQGLADGYNQISEEDGAVAVEEAFDYAKESIPIYHRYLKNRQNPVISDNFGNDLLL